MVKNILTILLLFVGLSLQATRVHVATTGNDASGNGTSGNPYLTISRGITGASAGDTVYINTGTYNVDARIDVPVGISLMGNPTGRPKVISTYNATSVYAIMLVSDNITDGNQSISYIDLDGSDYTCYGGILATKRNNVIVHHCNLNGFRMWGVRFFVNNEVGELSPFYATGNSIYDCTLTNCAGYGVAGYGAIGLEGQDVFLCDNNIIIQNKDITASGMPIKGAGPGIVRNVKITNNKIYMPQFVTGGHWDFAIELWDCRGNVEIANNYCEGSIDISGRNNIAEVGNYSVWIHHNTILQKEQANRISTRGFVIEAHNENKDIIIEYNHVKNTCAGISMGGPASGASEYDNIRIRYNLFESIGLSDIEATHYAGWGIVWQSPSSDQTINNFFVDNNVFVAKVGTYSRMWGLEIPAIVTTNAYYRNNIVTGFNYGPIFGYNNGIPEITCDGLWIENNIFYGNGNSNLPRYGENYEPTNNTTQNNIIVDPMFVSTANFRLQVGSPAIDAGINVGLTRDFDGIPVPQGLNPDIGAFEFIVPPLPIGGMGWLPIMHKQDFKDEVNLLKSKWMIEGSPVTASANDINDVINKAPVVSPVFESSITIAAGDTTVTPVLGRIVFKLSDSTFYGCTSTTASKKWYKLNE